MGSTGPGAFLAVSAWVGAGVTSLLALFFAWVAVTVPFEDEDDRFIETSDRIWTEVVGTYSGG
jgi:hypothetical protein